LRGKDRRERLFVNRLWYSDYYFIVFCKYS